MSMQFEDEDFQFGLEIALGCAYRHAADVGEVLATVARITDGDANSWVQEWTATAGAAETDARQAHAAGRRVSVPAHYRRAATYYATALYRVAHATRLAPGRELEIWRLQRECWEHVVDLLRAFSASHRPPAAMGWPMHASEARSGRPGLCLPRLLVRRPEHHRQPARLRARRSLRRRRDQLTTGPAAPPLAVLESTMRTIERDRSGPPFAHGRLT